MTTEQEYYDLRNRAQKLESTIQKLQADLYNAYREYQRLSEEAYKHAAISMREACIKHAVSLAESGVSPDKIRDVLSQISIYPSQRDDVSDVHED